MSVLYAVATTGTSTGSVNAMLDSFTPLGGLVPMFNLLAGCIWPGGVGAGLYGFLVVAIIAVFVAGLMVGRTPEYLGKKIEAREMKLAMLAALIYPVVVLGFSAASVLLRTALASLNNNGPHGLSEILYAYASTNANNGSAFAGLNGDTPWFNTTLGLAMLFGRFAFVIPVLALAGSLGAKKKAPASVGTFPTDGPLFVGLLIGVVAILYLLQYFPALALGPVVEHLLMLAGKTF
jgi:K+-transporting ATPase ATPase A chain